MMPLRIRGATRELGSPDGGPDCVALAVRDTHWNGEPVMVSVWELSLAELEELKNGGSVMLMVYGRRHPPVSLCVQRRDDEPAPDLSGSPERTPEPETR